MRADISIRVGELKDVPTLVAFNRAMARETEDKELPEDVVTDGVAALLRSPHLGFYVVAEMGEVVVGSLMVTFEWSDWRNAVFWWIQSVFVRPELRRQGVYRRLYQHVRELAGRQEDPRVCGFRLYVEKGNEVAKRTYQALGMQGSCYEVFEEGCQ